MKTSNPYTFFADYYDHVLRGVDYASWYRFLRSAMLRYNPEAERVLEIGTGTGKFGPKFSADGFSILGIDTSLDMLRVARRRARGNYKVACADGRDFSFNTTFDFIFSVHDTINYITDIDDVLSLMKCAVKHMKKDSIFLFDITTEFNILENFDNNSSDYYHNGCYIHWSNVYDKKKRIISSTIKFSDDSTEITEVHDQKIYTVDEIKRTVKKAGLEILDITADTSFAPPDDHTIMINFITRKK